MNGQGSHSRIKHDWYRRKNVNDFLVGGEVWE